MRSPSTRRHELQRQASKISQESRASSSDGNQVVARDGRMISVRKTESRQCILLPWYKVLILWDFLSVVFLGYTATYLPFRLAFVREEPT